MAFAGLPDVPGQTVAAGLPEELPVVMRRRRHGGEASVGEGKSTSPTISESKSRVFGHRPEF